MSVKRAKIRLFVAAELGPLQSVLLEGGQAHYLFNVMRLGVGDRIALFNGRHGEWTAEIVEARKKQGLAQCIEQAAPQVDPPDVWLLFAPIKKARTDFIVEKATELGARRILPVQTEFTNSERLRNDRLQAHAIEAAEQCGGTFVPEVGQLQKLPKVLQTWPAGRRLYFCDEALAEENQGAEMSEFSGPCAILVGPEGGFSEVERATLHSNPATQTLSLGPRILRADTAALAALTLWQAKNGDWR